MQVPPLETHRRDGLFFKYSTRELSLPSLSRTLHWNSPAISPALWKGETNKIKSDKEFFFPVSVSLRFNSTDWKRESAGEEESRVRGTANGEQGRGSNRKLGNGERKRRKWTAGHWKKKQRRRRLPVEEQLSTWIKPATGKASTIFISHFPGAAHAELDTQG